MEQDVQSLIDKLPLIPKDLTIFIVRKNVNVKDTNYKDFKVSRTKILRQLIFLKSNNKNYINVVIDAEALQLTPQDGSTFNQL